MPKADATMTPKGPPPPTEVYGMGTVQRIRDELHYLESKLEAMVHSNHKVEDALDRLSDELGSAAGVLEEIRDILKKKLAEDDDG